MKTIVWLLVLLVGCTTADMSVSSSLEDTCSADEWSDPSPLAEPTFEECGADGCLAAVSEATVRELLQPRVEEFLGKHGDEVKCLVNDGPLAYFEARCRTQVTSQAVWDERDGWHSVNYITTYCSLKLMTYDGSQFELWASGRLYRGGRFGGNGGTCYRRYGGAWSCSD